MALKFNQPIVVNQAPAGGEQVVVNQPNYIVSADRNGQVAQSIPTGVSTRVALNQEVIDFGGFYDPVLFEWTPAVGIYQMRINAGVLLLDNGEVFTIKIVKDSVVIYAATVIGSTNNLNPIVGSGGLVSSATGTEVFTMEVEHDHGSNLDISSDVNATYMYATLHTQSLEA